MSSLTRIFAFTTGVLLLLTAGLSAGMAASPTAVGDPLPRVVCSGGYTATIFAEGLSGPDGLAFDPISGQLTVAEESAGEVSQIPVGGGTPATLMSGLTAPEGIAYDEAGNLYVVEDTLNGRLLKYDTSGITTTLAISLTYPEGVTVGNDELIYITESELETLSADATEEEIRNLESRVSSIAPTAPYTLTTLVVVTPTIQEDLGNLTVYGNFASFAGITQGADNLLYVSNELTGVEIITETEVANPFFPIGPPTIQITAIFTSTDSIFTVDTQTTNHTLFASGLTTAEGVRFHGGGFPLYVAEEDISGADDNNTGRVSLVNDDGSTAAFCTGFLDLEDVIADAEGNFYISEDTSGYVIQLQPAQGLYLPFIITP